MHRWGEEVEILEEELRRLIRAFVAMDRIWCSISQSEQAPGRAAFAARKAQEYSYLASDARIRYARLGLLPTLV